MGGRDTRNRWAAGMPGADGPPGCPGRWAAGMSGADGRPGYPGPMGARIPGPMGDQDPGADGGPGSRDRAAADTVWPNRSLHPDPQTAVPRGSRMPAGRNRRFNAPFTPQVHRTAPAEFPPTEAGGSMRPRRSDAPPRPDARR